MSLKFLYSFYTPPSEARTDDLVGRGLGDAFT